MIVGPGYQPGPSYLPGRWVIDNSMSEKGVTLLGAVVNLFLSVFKVGSGLLFNSNAILADGLHSLSDLGSDALVLWGLHVSRKPADRHHPYGHLRIATTVALILGVGLTVMALWIVYDAIVRLRLTEENVEPLVPFIAALVSIVAKEILYHATVRVAHKTGNISLKANAWHHRTDAFTSVATAVGLGGIMFGGPKWDFLDNVTAVVLASFLLVAGVRIVYESLSELVDRAPRARVMESIRETLAGAQGVRGYHALRARKVGGKIAMDVHIQVDPEITVREADEIAELLREKILSSGLNIVDVVIHVDPQGEERQGV